MRIYDRSRDFCFSVTAMQEELTVRLGRGFSKRSLEQHRRFYDCYREIAQAVPAQSLDNSFGWQEIRHALSGKSPGSLSDAVIVNLGNDI